MTVATAKGNKVQVVVSESGQAGLPGVNGTDGAGFNNVRKSILDNPLLSLFKKNKLEDVISGSLTWWRSTIATYIDIYGVVKTAAINEPRAETSGWLIEGSSTNLFTYSSEFDNAIWSNVRATITPLAGIAPDGTSTAYLIDNDGTPSAAYLEQKSTPDPSAMYTLSLFAKANQSGYLNLRYRSLDGVERSATFDLNNGTTDASTAVSSSIKPISNGWFRISATFDSLTGSDSGAGRCFIFNPVTSSGNSVFIWGSQCEKLSFPSSYIDTQASTTTRTSDRVSSTGDNNVTRGSDSFTFTGRFKVLGHDSANRLWTFGASNLSSDSSYITINDGAKAYFTNNLNVYQFGQLVDFDTEFYFSLTYTDVEINMYVNGVGDNENPISTVGGFESIPNKITFGSNYNTYDNFLYGHILDFKVYDSALNEEEVKFLSGV